MRVRLLTDRVGRGFGQVHRQILDTSDPTDHLSEDDARRMIAAGQAEPLGGALPEVPKIGDPHPLAGDETPAEATEPASKVAEQPKPRKPRGRKAN